MSDVLDKFIPTDAHTNLIGGKLHDTASPLFDLGSSPDPSGKPSIKIKMAPKAAIRALSDTSSSEEESSDDDESDINVEDTPPRVRREVKVTPRWRAYLEDQTDERVTKCDIVIPFEMKQLANRALSTGFVNLADK